MKNLKVIEKKLEIERKLIANVYYKEINDIDDSDIERLSQYITINQAKDGNCYYWYLDCDNVEVISDMAGNIIDVEDSAQFFLVV